MERIFGMWNTRKQRLKRLRTKAMGTENVGLNQRQDFIDAFKKNIADMNVLGEYGIAQEYNKLLSFYEAFSGK